MYIKVNNKRIEIVELLSFWERLRSLKFVFEPISYGVKLSNKKYADTYLFCQRVDIMMTDKDNKILYLYENVKTEKRILFKRGVNNIYYLPLGSVKYLNIGEKIKENK